jgi:hypothetical protein
VQKMSETARFVRRALVRSRSRRECDADDMTADEPAERKDDAMLPEDEWPCRTLER